MNKKITVIVSTALLFSSSIMSSAVMYAEVKKDHSEVSTTTLEEAQVDVKATESVYSLSESDEGAIETKQSKDPVMESSKGEEFSLLNTVIQDTTKSDAITSGTWKGGTAVVRFELSTGTLTIEAGTITNLMDESVEVEYVDEANAIPTVDVQHIVFESGTVAPEYMYQMFSKYQFPNLSTISGDLDTRNVKNMSWLFYQASFLTRLDIGNWDVRNVNDMSYMFYEATTLTRLDIGNWDTRNVRNMENMFYEARNLREINLGNNITINSTGLSTISATGDYSGRWTRIKPEVPESIYESSAEFMANYDGSMPGTYVWELKKAGAVTVRYEDELGNTLIAPEVLNGKIGELYQTTAASIN
ncbi:BspA family leucine-rich repeat surface protein, partial [Enterococcus faecalis]|uniref:BspA family leucine-rich repeat surface protein n=1 Tax=Enterococcus faecalis TaxID=1351 RepID=UPI000353DCA0